MREVKRILWVDDNPENLAEKLFPSDETHIVGTMADAIRLFSGDMLYKYDTIVLDIDFEGGLGDRGEVVQKLREKIHLNKDQAEGSFIIENGGYLLFLYLLERGYPSNQIAFLTGNPNMIAQLKEFNERCLNEMSKEEIADAIIGAWEGEDGYLTFAKKIRKLPIASRYKDNDFIEECAFKLMEDVPNLNGVRELVENKSYNSPIDLPENTGDKIIFRFHDANLKAPVFFSKMEDGFKGHNLSDAEDWLNDQRTKEHLLRWLLLDAGDFVEDQFRKNQSDMEQQIHDIFQFDDDISDGGIRTAFRQMFFVIEGLRVEHKGSYYQAISAMLTPFEAQPKYVGDHVNVSNGNKESDMRRMFARCLKMARNYCAHNSMGTTLSIETTLFLLMLSLTAILNYNQRVYKEGWFRKVESVIKDKFVDSDSENLYLREKVLNITNDLFNRDMVDKKKSKTEAISFVTDSTPPRTILYAMGYNKEMDKFREPNVEKRENYYLFSIAAYILGWFNYESVDNITNMYDQVIGCVYKIATNIVNKYEYPKES